MTFFANFTGVNGIFQKQWPIRIGNDPEGDCFPYKGV